MKSFSEGRDFLIWRFLNGTTLCEEPWCRMHKMPFFLQIWEICKWVKVMKLLHDERENFCFDEKNTSLQDKNDNAIVITIQVPKTQRCWWWKLFFFLCQTVLSTFVTSCETNLWNICLFNLFLRKSTQFLRNTF